MMARGAALQRCGGFTLLELLIVVGLLSGLALMAYATVSDGENQRRFEDTAQRLGAIRRAVLGNPEPMYDGQVRLSGFVADNGLLPAALRMVFDGTGLNVPGAGDFSLRDPLFDPVPAAASCLNDGGESAPTWGAGDKLWKGWRPNYLPVVATGQWFRDGWGNHSIIDAADDLANHGWTWTLTLPSLTVTSRGLNNVTPTPPALPDTDFDAEQTFAVTNNGWDVDLSGWTVSVKNNLTPPTPLTNLRVSVLAYRNDGTAPGQWKRVTSSRIASLDADATDTVTFNTYCDNSSAPSTAGSSVIPQGRHLVVLVSDPDGAAHSADDAVSGTTPVTRQVAFFAGADRPSVTLEIR